MGADSCRRAAWFAGALLAALALPLALAQPFWQTVDDAFMAMIVHGYGVTAIPSPALVFSNVLYGKVVQLLPATIAGAQSYGVASYAVLGAAAVAAAWTLWRAAVPGPLAAAAVLVVFAPAALYPQFTVLAGLAAASGILLLLATERIVLCAAAVLMLLVAGLIRAGEVAFTAIFLLPFCAVALGRATWSRRRMPLIAAVVAAAGIAGAVVIDRNFYQAPAWRSFVEMNGVRLPFTDYGLRQYFMREPLEAMRLGFLPNDLVMIEGWFFADPRTFPAARVAELERFVSPVEFAWSNLIRYREALASFGEPVFLATLALALFAAWRARSRVAAWSLAAVGLAAVAAWLAGRPGITRIFLPPLAGILLLALQLPPARSARWHAAVAFAIAAALGAALWQANAADRAQSEALRARLCRMPAERLYVAWANKLPYDMLYRPLSSPGDDCPLRIYPLAVHSYAPYVVEQLRAATGSGDAVGALLLGRDLDMIADRWQIDTLRRHLRFHYRRVLQDERLGGDGEHSSWYRLRLAPEATP